MARIRLTGFDHAEMTTVRSLTGNLAELLVAMLHDGRALIAVCDLPQDRYVQFWCQANGRLIGEVVSNHNLDSSSTLPAGSDDRLRELGFQEPCSSHSFNWWFESSDAGGTRETLVMMTAAIHDVLGAGPSDRVRVRTWMAMHQPEEGVEAVSIE
jgi:hypothetical protein